MSEKTEQKTISIVKAGAKKTERVFMDKRGNLYRQETYDTPDTVSIPNSNYKRHIINEQGNPICMSHTRSFSLSYTDEQCNCKKCFRIERRIKV